MVNSYKAIILISRLIKLRRVVFGTGGSYSYSSIILIRMEYSYSQVRLYRIYVNMNGLLMPFAF